MKNIILTILLLSLQSVGFSQIRKSNLSVNSLGNPLNYNISAPKSDIGFSLHVDENTKWIEYQNSIANQPLTNFVFLEGTKKINVFASIPQDSISLYRYNITLNDSVLLSSNRGFDTLLKVSEPNGRAKFDLGSFNVENKKLTIETYKLTTRNRVSSVTIYNKEIQPVFIGLVTLSVKLRTGEEAFQMRNRKSGFSFKIRDSVAVNSIVLVAGHSDLSFIYQVYLKNLSSGKVQSISNNWIYGNFSGNPYLSIDASFFQNPGDYEIQIIPKLSSQSNAKTFPEKLVKIRFTVLKSSVSYSSGELIGWIGTIVAIVIFISVLIIYILRRNNNKRIIQERNSKELTQSKLDSARSQLNPHFLFNALAGIQNLINSNESDQANRYLTKFARLTRNVLDNNEMNSLSKEVRLLTDYLEMEQLRFDFNFRIIIEDSLDLDNTNIPSMLIQPFVENAVKHGVGGIGSKGEILIDIRSSGRDIIIAIKDNGLGFNAERKHGGLGLELSRKRIELLNSIYKETPLMFNIDSSGKSTVVTITLKEWL